MSMIENNEIVLTNEAYNQLIEDSIFLDALRAAGVDNWDGYDIAQDMVREWNSED